MKCLNCGEKIQDTYNFCPCCGKALLIMAKTSNGRITLPKFVRVNLQLKDEDYVTLEINEDKKSYTLRKESKIEDDGYDIL